MGANGHLVLLLAIQCLSVICPVLGVLSGEGLNGTVQPAYDYIICGCGIAGLVMARRLSEDEGVSVLCIEAGSADQYEPEVLYPVYVGNDVGGEYDWNLATVPQAQLDGEPRPLPQGKVLGGGSILNGMVWHRAGADDYDAWNDLGATDWAWADLLPYFIKSENFTPIYNQSVEEMYSVHSNPDVHGWEGPVSVSYPRYFYPQSVNFYSALTTLGVPTTFDPNEGNSVGAAFLPQDLNPWNQTRSDARITYYDPVSNRSNLQVILNQHVTRVILDQFSDPSPGPTGSGVSGDGPMGSGHGSLGFDPELETAGDEDEIRRRQSQCGTPRAIGVEFAPDDSSPRQIVYARREVIIAAGALHTTQILQLSGIGPASILDQYNITVAADLPGVRNNLQDHCLVATFYPYNNASYPIPTMLLTNSTWNSEAETAYINNRTGPWTAGAVDALAFLSLPSITNQSNQIIANATAANATAYLPANLTDPTLIAGYMRQRESVLERLGTADSPAIEIINNNAGSLTVALMHPLSRGTCAIGSADPFTPPVVDPRWLSDPTDRAALMAALLFNREILATPAMQELMPAQFVPAADATLDQLQRIIDDGVETEFHVSGTAAMLPLELGGVVDTHCRVHGVEGLRVVDASVFPLVPGGHLQAPVYAVAEKAADIVKMDNIGAAPVSVPVSAMPSVLNGAASGCARAGPWQTGTGRPVRLGAAKKKDSAGNSRGKPSPNIPGWTLNKKQLEAFLSGWAREVWGECPPWNCTASRHGER